MNKRQSKKQRRLSNIRILEEMNQHRCAVLIKDLAGASLIVLDNPNLEVVREDYEPSAVVTETIRIEGSVEYLRRVVIKDGR